MQNAIKGQLTTLTGWACTTGAAGDILKVQIAGTTGVKSCAMILGFHKV
jgi:hypothetical protein